MFFPVTLTGRPKAPDLSWEPSLTPSTVYKRVFPTDLKHLFTSPVEDIGHSLKGHLYSFGRLSAHRA